MAIPFPKRFGATMLALAAGAAALAASTPASALNLQEAYQLALQNDPVYRSAFYENEGGKESRIIGRSYLLPSLVGNLNTSKNVTDIESESTNLLGKPVTSLTHPKYTSRIATVQLRQPLFNLEALARYNTGKAQSEMSEQVFSARGQELLMRVIGAYIDALFADDQVALAESQRDAFKEQQMVSERLLKDGEGTRTDLLEVQGRYQLSEAQLIESRDAQANARDTLEGIIGTPVETLAGLNSTFRMRPLEINNLEEWRATALKDNPELQAQLTALEVARQQIKQSSAGHYPKLDFVASYSQNKAETINTFNQDATIRAIGIQLVVPLYQGGAISASTRQAVAALEKARADLQTKTDKVMVEVNKQFKAVQSGVARVAALDRAVDAGNLLITATQQSIKGGVRINLDLLNARQQLFLSKRDLAQARYGYMLAILRLRAAAGTLDANDVNQTASFFR